MDATKRPLFIPPGMGLYAEKHCLYDMMQGMLENLLINQPEEPIEFLISHLRYYNKNASRILLLGPPASGKTTIAKWLSKHLLIPYISKESLLACEWSTLAGKAQEYLARNKEIPRRLWAQLTKERLQLQDCLADGWIIEGFPETREMAQILQEMGIIARHVVVLYAPDVVLIERNLGKRVDVLTGEVYHTTFDWPTNENVRHRLRVPDNISETATSERLLKYHQNYPGILRSYGETIRLINADQPCADVFWQVLSHVRVPPRSLAPFSPRIIICGPPGSGKSLQASLIAQKYGLINVSCGQMLKEAVADETKIGELIKPYIDSGWPVADNIVMKVITDRLNRLDCHIRGWVLHDFPRDKDQARMLKSAGIHPNRVFFLNVTTETILERLSYRMLDPITGDRYHTLYKPAISKDANDRLLIHPKDMEDYVKEKIEIYFRLSSSLEEFYEEVFFINGDQEPQTVFEYIESYLCQSLPIKPEEPLTSTSFHSMEEGGNVSSEVD